MQLCELEECQASYSALGGTIDSQEVTRLLVPRLMWEGQHWSSWSLGTVTEQVLGFYFLQWNCPCLDTNTIMGCSDLEKSSLCKHFFYFILWLKISEPNMNFGLNLTMRVVQVKIILVELRIELQITNHFQWITCISN